jgi:hypothetical protein
MATGVFGALYTHAPNPLNHNDRGTQQLPNTFGYYSATYGGGYRLPGTVGEFGPPEAVIKSIVVLMDRKTTRPVMSMESAADGTYEFFGIANKPWTVFSYHPTAEFNAVVADMLDPIPITPFD